MRRLIEAGRGVGLEFAFLLHNVHELAGLVGYDTRLEESLVKFGVDLRLG